MGYALIIKKITEFLGKNWKVIGVILAFLMLTGKLKRYLGRLQIWWSMNKVKNSPEKIDYEFIAMSINNALAVGLFDWKRDQDTVIAMVNTMRSMDEYLQLCKVYAMKHGKDLRQQIRKTFSDKDYAKLIYR